MQPIDQKLRGYRDREVDQVLPQSVQLNHLLPSRQLILYQMPYIM